MRRAETWIGAPGWRRAAALLLIVALLPAADARADEGIQVRDAATRLQGGVWFLDADIDYGLNKTVLEALDSGLVLDVDVTIRLTQRRRIIWDSEFAQLRQRYELQFHALTERFILRNLNSGEQSTYGSLQAALASLGMVRTLPIIDDALLDRGERYFVAMRAVVEIRKRHGPMAVLRFIWNDWQMASDWVQWRLKQ